MWFINKGKPVKFRLGTHQKGYRWVILQGGEKMDLPREIGNRLGLEEMSESDLPKVTKSKIGQTKVETKQFDYTPDDLFFKELQEIKGIGKKTAEDIVAWGTKEKLIEAINKKEKLPFRNDVADKLNKKFG